MKNIYIILFTSLTLFYSCQNGELTELKTEIIKLNELNKKLNDSLKDFKYKSILNSYLIGIPENHNFKINEIARIKFGLFKGYDNQIFDIYKIDRESNKRVLLEKDWNKANYTYEFTPKSMKDREIEIIFEFDINGHKIDVNSPMSLYLTD